MNNQIKSTIILIDNLLNNPKKYSRQSLAEKLEREHLPHTASAITRLLKFIDEQIGIKIRVDRSKFIYIIDVEASCPNFVEQYYQYKNLCFRSLIHKTSINVPNEYISFGFTTEIKNIEFINPLLNAIINYRKVSIEYLPFYDNETTKFVVKPLFIREYLNRWYLITDKLEHRHAIFAIDRIEKYDILTSKYTRTKEMNAEIYKNTIGVNYAEPIEKIVLWVSKNQYHYFKTLPFHTSQKTEKGSADGFIISFIVTLNFELKQWIMFYGNSIKVIEPKSLKEEIISNLKKNLEQYEK